MAEALAIAGAGRVASQIITSLLNEGFSSLGIGIKAKLQDLETTILPQFQLVIQAAESSTDHNDKLRSWLSKLKDAVYEAEYVLDEYKYQLLEEEVSDLNNPARNPFEDCIPAGTIFSRLHSCWHNLFGDCIPAGTIFSSLHSFWHNLFGGLNPFTICYRQNVMLRRSLNKLKVIADEAQTFRELLQIRIGNDGQNLRNEGQPNVTSYFLLHQTFGREQELVEIIEKYLLDPSEASQPQRNYSVGAIVGIGGAGKTTFAQLVYNDKRVVDYFDIKMWVCISRKLDLAKHTKDMIQSSGKSKGPNLDTPAAIQPELVKLVESKKILLVLDDVWFDRSMEETEEEWLTLVAPLAKSVKSGSKILVTTRTKILPVALRPRYSMELEDLEENHILSLFKLHAFGSTELDGSRLQDELMTIGKQIVQKLHRSPLAARAVGSRLGNTLNVGAWRSALEEDNLRDSHKALLWSYQRLDAPLQRCFSYCSLFPKGERYDADEMVRLWIAEGFINSSNNSKRMEDIGMEYFNELVSGSFFQQDKYYYNMHDLFHDLAEKVSKEDCLRIEDGDEEKEIPPTIRRLSIRGDQVEVNNISFNKLENLRTLMIEDGSLSSHAFANLLTATEKYKKLRVLIIDDFVSRGTLTKLMANLKHLRILSFRWNEEGEIPAAVGKLYHLQVLYAGTKNDASLPRSVKNLINLRYFGGDELTSLPDLGRLTSLQKLPNFVVKKEKGHDIGQLKNLKEIRGSLTISNLENVEGKDEALEANLEAKRHLESLHLVWDSNDESESKRDLDMKVLEGLQPHPNLTKLSIEGYRSPRFPSLLLREGCLQNLRYLILKNCTALQVLPSLPQSLKDLEIFNCPSLIIVSGEEVQTSDEDRKKSIMTSMQNYLLINRELKAEEVARYCLESDNVLEDFMTLWTALQSCEERVDDLNLQKAYYRCQELRLEAIFGRREKSELILPSSLQTLKLDRCNITDGALSQSLQGLTSLKSFQLNNISTVTTLPGEEVLHHLIALTELKIHGCHMLKWLGGLYALPSLEELKLYNCLSISSLPVHLPQSLNSLQLDDCYSISSLPEHLPQSLNSLKLSYCPSISSLPEHLPQSLNRLMVFYCPSISSLPEHLPQSLSELFLYNCPRISSLSKHLPQSLSILALSDCPSISSLPEHLPQSLNILKLYDCPSISSLPEHLPQSLNNLNLSNCPSISSLPKYLPQSLEYISIRECQILEERCRSPNGEDWPKIAHFPRRDISYSVFDGVGTTWSVSSSSSLFGC